MEPSAKIEIELSCAVVGWSSGVFNVALDIGEETTVADGVKQMQAKLPFLAKAKTASVIMYLTKACDNDWLEDSDDIRSQLRSKTTTDTIKALLTSHLHPGSLLKDANLRDCPYGRIHLLLDVTQGMLNDAPHAPFSIAFSSRPSPSPLVKSPGAHWDFQNPPSRQDLDKAVRQQYQAWKSQEGVDRTIFACLDGPGMGKSRMLQEFPSLLRKHINPKGAMKVMLDSAVVFNITFEHEATSFVDPFTGVAESIGSRMLFELSDKETPWPYFTAVPDHHVIPSQVIGRVKEGNDVHQDEMCVILCVDDLHEVLETRHQTLKQVVECLVNLKKTLKCWVIVAFSALTLSLELKEMITSSATIIPLETTKLRRPTENGVPVFTPKPVKPDIDVQAALEDMLINDMGGFPRALELLAEVLSDQSQSNSDVEFGPVIRQILLGLQVKYRGLKAHMKTLEKAFVAAIAGRIVNKTDTFGSLTVDQIAISGLIRHQNDRFECPYILYLLFDSKTFPWCNGCPYVPSQDRERVKPWQAWEDLNCLFRAIKSMAYDGEIVNWTQLHHGAAFGTDTDIFVHEQTRKYELRVHKTESRSTQGGQASKCCDQAGSFIYRSAAAASCGDAFACLKINEDDYIHEVHQYKHLQRVTGEDSFKEEYEKACGPRDLFVFFATNKVVLPRIPSRCAIVDSTCWKAYYGLFWPRMFFVECIPPPCLNNSSRELLELVSGIGPKRSAEITSMRPFENVKDASSRTSVPKHVLKRLRVTPPKTSS